MALLERVGTLLRANVNNLIDKAENPEKMLKQLLLDMENQLLQVKTQVAIAVADQHLLEKKKAEHEVSAEAWRGRAELAVRKEDDALARAALERSLSYEQLAAGFGQQIEDQRAEAETMRGSYSRLRQKLVETEAEGELVLAQHRRARAAQKARVVTPEMAVGRTMRRLKDEALRTEAQNFAARRMGEADTEVRLRTLEREERVEALLAELKTRPKLLAN